MIFDLDTYRTMNILVEYVGEPCIAMEIMKDVNDLNICDKIMVLLSQVEKAEKVKDKIPQIKILMKYFSINLDFLKKIPEFYDIIIEKIVEFSIHNILKGDKEYETSIYLIKNMN